MIQHTRGLVWLGLLSCLCFAHCGPGSEGAPCQISADCISGICSAGTCHNPGSDRVPAEKSTDTRAESTIDREAVSLPDDAGPADSQTSDDSQESEKSKEPNDRDGGEATPEGFPEPIVSGAQHRFGLSSGGGRMTSSSYHIYGSVSAGLLGAPQQMSSQQYQIKGGLLTGTQP